MSEEKSRKPAPAARRRPSARRDLQSQSQAPSAKPEPTEKRKRAPARAPRAARPQSAGSSELSEAQVTPDVTHGELQAVEQGVDALLHEVGRGAEDGEAQQRTVAAFSQLASRLSPGQPSESGSDDVLMPKARRYLSAGYYMRQWGERGMRHRADRVDDFGLDRTYEASVRPFFELMANKYFRVEIEGLENVPSKGRALLIGNHSGTLPWDGVMLRTALRQHHPVAREMRWLVEDYVYHAPFLGSFVNRIGAVRACQENAQRLLENEELVAVFPEGIKGIAKHWSDRYKLQRFGRGGYVKLALRTSTPVIPVAIIGAEETYPLLHMAKAFSKVLGVPFLPVTPTFPLLGPLGLAPLPSRWRIVIGQPVRELEAHRAEDARDEVLVGELNQRVRTQVESLVQAALATRGKRVFV